MEATGAGPPEGTRSGPLTRGESEIEFSRVVAFSDGVFAIAITLLVLALDVPEGVDDLGESLVDQSDDFFAYLLSFAVLGKLWLSHHRFFAGLGHFDGPLMGLNLVYLAGVALVPFSSEVLGDNSSDSAAVILYAANMSFVSAAFLAQIIYSFRKKLVKDKFLPYEKRFTGPASFGVTVVFLASIPVAVFSPTAATLMWLAIFVLGRRVGDRVAGVKAPRIP
jgi:uncharacterized membrane protein